MLNAFIQPRILFVTSEVMFIPCRVGDQIRYRVNHHGGFIDFLSNLIVDLYCQDADVHVVQPDYRRIFSASSQEVLNENMKNLPEDRLHLAKDRTFFYSNYPESNNKWENIKLSIAFQREVINRIIPEVQPGLIHCHDWMTGFIPAMAKIFDIPCLFTIQNPDTAKIALSYVEDMGMDALAFWQHLFYEEYPVDYEEIRESNPANFLLSGIIAANFVNAFSSAFQEKKREHQNRFSDLPFWELLVEKKNIGCAAINENLAESEQFLDVYQRLLN